MAESLPNPIARAETYLYFLCQQLQRAAGVTDDDFAGLFQTAVGAYLDEHGLISSDGVTEDDVQTAINAYLDEHGVSDVEVATMTEFMEAVYNGENGDKVPTAAQIKYIYDKLGEKCGALSVTKGSTTYNVRLAVVDNKPTLIYEEN